ncbi:hypothetical protein SAMN05192588_2421 [Nonlabens sp. Hel1_33_55]|uniref:hypothetical protein n=1 Tax=Nonlabens sp. Hel1_33_55 TaxID=1336802 RepID=UPI000875E4A2|nr:hypothetical protein [Nonlabens sp. Hel1_33_55]SCY35058.1 hypothetical protein SAMN05192588_2421 [Nonlabens sp. Hel1_33_55]
MFLRQVGFFLCVLLVFNSCTPSLKEDDNLLGCYKSSHVKKWELRALKRSINPQAIAMGPALNLMAENKFIYDSCGTTYEGDWIREGDSIFLKYTSYHVRAHPCDDTDQEHAEKTPDAFFKFKITESYLVAAFDGISVDKRMWMPMKKFEN